MRTVYDGLSFEVVREGETHGNGRLTTEGALGAVLPVESDIGAGVLSRYRYVEEEGGVRRNRYEGELVRGNEGEAEGTNRGRGRRYVGISVTLYAKGEAVAVNRLDTERYAGGTGYLGKDIMGSVQGVTDGTGREEGRYEYDVFGEPYLRDFGTGIGLGYTGKPYDPVTGMYDYGYRDYRPENARFTTEDPIRDGANWFAYVNNDPVNYIDLWGLSANDVKTLLYAQQQLNIINVQLVSSDPYVLIGQGLITFNKYNQPTYYFQQLDKVSIYSDMNGKVYQFISQMGGSKSPVPINRSYELFARKNDISDTLLEMVRDNPGYVYYSYQNQTFPGYGDMGPREFVYCPTPFIGI
jgi:RHS repeat-associated protein